MTAELQAAFARHQPQGSLRWNFLDAYMRLEHGFGTPAPSNMPPSASTAAPAGRALRLRRFARRVLGLPPVDLADDVVRNVPRLVEAMAGVVEAFRFLSARVETMEATLARVATPLPDMARLVPSPDLAPWVDAVVSVVSAERAARDVVHTECGQGALLEGLSRAGVPAWGADPRGEEAALAIEAGHRAKVEEAAEALAQTPPASLGAVVLSGVVDRLDVAGLVALVGLAGDCLHDGGVLVVLARRVSTGAGTGGGDAVKSPAEPGWSGLLPGRPLGVHDWTTLLEQSGFAVEPLKPSGTLTATAPAFGLVARWTR
ncbi:MAG TPA: hypothetical protein VE991_00030 [Acidimicrobiales bacterium]|nr:hypothetical protein [Acidimicrobiales bacterium]